MERRRPKQLLYQMPNEIVERLKVLANIDTPNADMTDAEIKAVMRVVAVNISGKIPLDEHLATSRIGIELMLSLTLMVFPDYYEQYGLTQFN
jgi:hypothetical protein